jgi:hypothetical protein
VNSAAFGGSSIRRLGNLDVNLGSGGAFLLTAADLDLPKGRDTITHGERVQRFQMSRF